MSLGTVPSLLSSLRVPGIRINNGVGIFRQRFFNIQNNSGQSLPVEVTAGSRATDIRELRQARKGAAVTVLDVCRGSAWLSLVPAILFVAKYSKIRLKVFRFNA